jgi:quercetin dioxygenase-like cupin family protein
MKMTLIMAVTMMIVGSGLAPEVAQAQQATATKQPGTKRTDLQRHDLSIPGREVIQVRVDFDPGYVAPRHVYDVEGRPPTTYKAGEVLMVPAGAIHSVKNIGSGNGAELATYVVEKGKPLITLVK